MRLTTRRIARNGFTLLEVLIVITIMVLLASLTLSAVFKGLQLIRRSNTERTMQKVHERLGLRQEAIAGEADKIEPNAALLTLAGGDRQRARVLLQKLITRWSFPMSFDEIQTNWTQSTLFINSEGHPSARFFETRRQGATGGVDATNPATLALIYERLGGLDDLSGGERSAVQIGGQTFTVILDSWGNPMRFYRSPVDHTDQPLGLGRNLVERAMPREKWSIDADDPLGLLDLRRPENYDTNGTTPDWYNINDSVYGFGLLGQYVHNNIQHFRAPVPPVAGWTPVYCPMTMVSAGPDGQWGLTPNDYYMSLVDPVNLGQAADNFYSYRSRLGLVGQ
jgi:prepilin-type N-terminal cleavage/methylation domain-containing protein